MCGRRRRDLDASVQAPLGEAEHEFTRRQNEVTDGNAPKAISDITAQHLLQLLAPDALVGNALCLPKLLEDGEAVAPANVPGTTNRDSCSWECDPIRLLSFLALRGDLWMELRIERA
jgi:hypothetical protein